MAKGKLVPTTTGTMSKKRPPRRKRRARVVPLADRRTYREIFQDPGAIVRERIPSDAQLRKNREGPTLECRISVGETGSVCVRFSGKGIEKLRGKLRRFRFCICREERSNDIRIDLTLLPPGMQRQRATHDLRLKETAGEPDPQQVFTALILKGLETIGSIEAVDYGRAPDSRGFIERQRA